MASERMARTLTLVLPWPPSVNGYYAVIRGRKILSKAGRKYKVDVLAAVLEQVGRHKPIEGRVRLSVWLAPPDRRVRDVSNALKSLEDSLTSAGVWRDDSQVDEIRAFRIAVAKPGRAVVKIREIA
jgi:crossover junction endodeoxyribonuclease RusA